MIVGYSRASAGGGWTPLSLPNLWAWWDANQEVYTNGQDLSTGSKKLHDFSGGGNDFAYGLTGHPTYNTNILNGKPGVLFDGSSFFISGSNTAGAATTIAALVKWASGRASWGSSGSHTAYVETTPTWNMFSFSGTVTGPTTDTSPHKLITIWKAGASASTLYLDGSGTTGTCDAFPTGQILIGDDTFGLHWNGYIFEFIVMNGEITGGDITNLDSYWGTKYGF